THWTDSFAATKKGRQTGSEVFLDQTFFPAPSDTLERIRIYGTLRIIIPIGAACDPLRALPQGLFACRPVLKRTGEPIARVARMRYLLPPNCKGTRIKRPHLRHGNCRQ